MELLTVFPRLRETPWEVTSPAAADHNCVAWAAGDETRWWWPLGEYYWPPTAPREETVEAFVAAFSSLGYERCDDDDFRADPEYEKVAIYAKHGTPTHMARQLVSGEWSSKCGGLEDITHALDALGGAEYGAPVAVMRRRRAAAAGPP